MSKYGFLGLGIMGTAMATKLLESGFDVTVWNRNPDRCIPLKKIGAHLADSPMEMTASCDITFAMLADPEAAREVCFGKEGVLAGIGGGRGYIDMSTVDDETSRVIAESVAVRGGRFLEAPVSGTKKPAEDGSLIILAAGDHSLYEEATPAFEKMGKKTSYLGDVGQGARTKLIINMIMCGMLTAFCEGLALGRKSGIDCNQLLEILASGSTANPMFAGKGLMLLKGEFPTSFPLKHMQKDLRLAIKLGDEVGQPLPCAATNNETFKRARSAGYADEDVSAVFKVIT